MQSPGNMRPLTKWADDLRSVIKYFDELGVPLVRGRIRTYSEVIAAAERNEPVDKQLLGAAICEVYDLVACTTLEAKALRRVRHRLANICGGNAVFTSASGDDPGRNLGFELVTAAMFQASGAKSKLQKPSDVAVSLGGEPLLVECKRPTTHAALGRRLKEGYRQMSVHRRNGHQGLGAIAIELSVLVNPLFGEIAGTDPAAAMDSIYRHMQRIFTEASEHLARAARDLRKDAGVHLLLFRVRSIIVASNGERSVAQVWQLHPTVKLDSLEFHALSRLMAKQPAFFPGVTVIAK